MLLAISLPLVGLLLGLPGLPGISLPGFKDLKKLRQGKAAALDSLPPAWKSASRLGLENSLLKARLQPLGPFPVALKISQDPRQLRVGFDADSGAVVYVTEFNNVTVGDPFRLPVPLFARELTERNFKRIWDERAKNHLQSGAVPVGQNQTGGDGIRFELPSPLPKRFQGILGPGGPSLTVSGSENIRLSGTSNWTNSQVGQQLGQRRSLFPSLDMQQDLDIRLEGRLSDRVGVNLLQNSANQIPLANRIAINYKGDEDDLVQVLDLGNTNLTLPGTQYVSYSGKNEGLFGMKTTTRVGPLDFTFLASKQEGRSERAQYAGGSSRQTQVIADKDYVRGVYFFLYDPNGFVVQDIDENSIELYVDDAVNTSQSNIVRGRAFVDPNNRCIDPVTCLDGPDADSDPDTTRSVRGTFRKLTLANQDYEILSSFYGPSYKVIRLRSPVSGEHCLAVTYRYRESVNEQPVGASVPVGGLYEDDIDYSKGTRVPALTMKVLRAPLAVTPPDSAAGTGLFSTRSPFYVTRELELKNIYHLGGQNIDAKSFMLAIRQGNDQPPVTTVTVGSPPTQEVVPFIEILGLDNFDETSGFPGYDKRSHDGFVDATGPTSRVRAAVDFVRGTLFLPDPRPFAPRLAADTSGRRFDRVVDSLLTRRAKLTGGRSDANAANPDIYDKYSVLPSDAYYSLEPVFTAQTAGNEINLGRSNIIEGSDVVRINGQPLQRDKDYRIDYDLGRVTLIRQLLPADQLDIDYSYAPLFQQAGKTLLGSAFRLEGRDKSLGGAFLYESRGATDLRPRLGEEPSQVVIGDLNTDWKFKPSWMTRLADVLPGVRTSQPSELNIQAEMGVSLPNPNTRNEVYIDDMEGSRDAVSLSMGPDRWRWSSVPLRTPGQTITIDDTTRLSNPQHNAEIHWYSPLNVVKERDLKPSLTPAQGAQNTHQSLAISIPRRPTAFATDTTQKLWVGLTYPLDPGGIDLSRSQFIELWVNDFRDHHNNETRPRVRGRNVKLHIDLGVVPEDQQRAPNIPPNRALDTEDRVYDGQLTVTEGNNEDTGLDSLLSREENPQPIPDLVTVSLTGDDPDPSGDNFRLPDPNYTDWDPRKWLYTNGTEDNKNVEPVPDTEDMNQNNRLDGLSDYFEYTIDLGDTLYLATDVHDHYTHYEDGDLVPEDNGWRRYRIPIDDKARQRFGNPVLETARHLRIWLEDIVLTDPAGFPPVDGKQDGRPFIVLGGIEIVGNRWLATDLDSTSRAAGTTLTLNTVNTTDNAEIYVPPFDPGSTRSGSQEVVRREQTMAIEFTNLADRDTLEVFKTVSLDEDYSRYGKLNWFAAAYEIPDYVEASDTLDYFVRFASDERGDHYYEYRARLPRSSEPLKINWKEVSLALTELSNIKLNQDFPSGGPILYYAPGRVPGEVFVIKGRPAFTRLRRISFGLINLSGKAFPSGQLWFNELRATDVAKDRGQAERLNVNGRVANLVNYNFMYNKADAHFQAVGQNRGTGNTDNTISLQTGVDLHRFIESSRILLPFNYTYNRFMSSPRFTAGDDVVRTGALAEASDTRVMTRTMSLSYSRTWGDRSNPLLRYTLGGFTANVNRSQNEVRNPTNVSANTQTAAAVNYSIAPRQILTLGVPLTRLKIYPFPERFYWNYSFSTNEGASYNRERDSLGTLVLRNVTNARVAGIDFGMDSRPIDMFHHSFRAHRNLTLPTELLERVGIINFGRVVDWSQNMDARYSPQRLGQWLRPNMSWRSSYRQDNGPQLSPDLSVKGIGNTQAVTVDWDLPFDKLAGPTRVAASGDTVRRRGPGILRRLLSRIGPLRTNGAFNTSSSHSHMRGMPSPLYFAGLSTDPGFADTLSDVRTVFGNRSTDQMDWRTGASTTFDLGFGTQILANGDIQSGSTSSNGVESRTDQVSFPRLDVTYGKVAEIVQLHRLLVNPRLKTRFNRSQSANYDNFGHITTTSTSSQWQPLIELEGELKNGTRTRSSIERRVTQTQNRVNGSSVTTDRISTLNFSINRSYSKGQKVSVLGKETTVRSNINLGLSAAYELQDAETVDAAKPGEELQVTNRDRLSVNATGGYGFSSNVTGNLEFGFGQNRDLARNLINRSLRIELRAQFTF